MPPKHNPNLKKRSAEDNDKVDSSTFVISSKDGPENIEEDSSGSPALKKNHPSPEDFTKVQMTPKKRPPESNVHSVEITPNTRSKYGFFNSVPVSNTPVHASDHGLQATTTALKDGKAIAITVRSKRGGSVYVRPLTQELLNNPEVRYKLKINLVKNRVDPNNPTTELLHEARTPGGYNPPEPVFITLVENPTKNTPENRQKQVQALCSLNNSKDMQRNGYNNNPGRNNKNNLMVFAGDVTPENLADAPYLSDFLTVGDVMDFMAEEFLRKDNGAKMSDNELVSSQELMDAWFNPKIHDMVRNLYIESGSKAPGFTLPELDL